MVNKYSPAKRMIPVGENVAAGIGQGASGYSFSLESTAIGNNLRAALTSSISRAAMRSLGLNAMNGLAAGINAGKSGAISAMRIAANATVAAAKSALKIASPSGVFRDEVGVMAMRGIGEGILSETKAQAAAIKNATRYLNNAIVEGSVAGVYNSGKTYNQQSTVNLTVSNMTVRDEQDIHALAAEIAALTKRQQRGMGLRMA